MTARQARYSLQLMAEERIGWLQRERALQRRAQEDAAWNAMTSAVGKP